MPDLTSALQTWLSAGPARVGQVLIRPAVTGWELRHADDENQSDLVVHTAPEAARHIANLDVAGNFRPLKTAPNLAGGWSLVLPDIAAVRRALDYLYPAMTALWFSSRQGKLSPITFRETLGRQTGMYRVTQKITDAQAREMIDRYCAGCLKQRLWDIDGPTSQLPQFEEREFPILCHEACNLLVAEARTVVKAQTA